MDEQIKELNTFVLTKLAPSDIHGVGVFALRDIPKDHPLFADMMTKIYDLPYEEFHRLRPEVRTQLLERWPNIVNGSKFAYPDTRVVAFMNHSDKPNYDAVNDKTLRDIKAGEEITEDYKQIEGWDKVFDFMV